jgi:hypothetical protein
VIEVNLEEVEEGMFEDEDEALAHREKLAPYGASW